MTTARRMNVVRQAETKEVFPSGTGDAPEEREREERHAGPVVIHPGARATLAMERPARIAGTFIMTLAAVFAFLELFMVQTLRPLPHGRSLALGTFGAAFLVPELAIVAFLATLPIFGNKPATPQFHYFLLIQSAFYLGLLARELAPRILRRRPAVVLPPRRPETGALWTVVLAYGVASVLSLCALPLRTLAGEVGARIAEGGTPRSFAAALLSFFSLAEDRQAYAVLASLLTVLSIAIGGLIMKRTAVSEARIIRAGAAILTGLLVSLGAGLLDYYRVIDLRVLRGLDPLVNPGNAQFRLQSFFGHSGWFAEYVTLTVPFALLVLLERAPFLVRVIQCLLILLVGEYVLILTYQRGGWVSYPLTLFAVWAAIYVIRRLETGERDVRTALRRSILKVCLSLPITILLSLLLISFGMRTEILSPEVKTNIGSYIGRFETISKTSDRTDFMLAGYRIGALHPFLGAGSESFGYQFHREFELPTGHFPGTLTLPFHGTAHTVYFQILSGKGVAGLVLLLVAVAYVLVPAVRIVTSDHGQTRQRRVFLLAASCFACSFLIYGVVQEVFYIQCLQVLFFVVLALSAAAMQEVRFSRRDHSLLWGFLGLMFALHLFWEKRVFALMNNDHEEQAGAFGCYLGEKNADGRSFRWCAPKARVLLPRKRDELGAYAELRLGMDFISPGLERGTVTVRVGREVRLRAVLAPLGENTFRVPLVLGDPLVRTGEGVRVAVDLEADTHFIPQFIFGSGDDYRMLSFRLYQ